jgi:hypothetical protein
MMVRTREPLYYRIVYYCLIFFYSLVLFVTCFLEEDVDDGYNNGIDLLDDLEDGLNVMAVANPNGRRTRHAVDVVQPMMPAIPQTPTRYVMVIVALLSLLLLVALLQLILTREAVSFLSNKATFQEKGTGLVIYDHEHDLEL